jgi:hypothetical protein
MLLIFKTNVATETKIMAGKPKCWRKISVTDPDPGSSVFLTPGSGMSFFRISYPKLLFLTALSQFLGWNTLILCQLAQICLYLCKNKILYNLVKFMAKKKVGQKEFFSSSFFILVRSGIRDPGWKKFKLRDPGSGINIQDPQHCQENKG